MSPSPSGGALPPPLQARLAASLQGADSRGGRKVAVFDADGTLWADDVGERHLTPWTLNHLRYAVAHKDVVSASFRSVFEAKEYAKAAYREGRRYKPKCVYRGAVNVEPGLIFIA